MCTALCIRTERGSLFGRNMDLSRGFGQQPLFIPRRAALLHPATAHRPEGLAVLGMGTMLDDYPALADGLNEKGLACAALNFADSCRYAPSAPPYKTALPPWDLMLWALRRFEDLEALRQGLREIEIVDLPPDAKTPLPTLHWMFTDRSGKSLVVERTRAGLTVRDNPVGVLANDPPFDWQYTNLRNYLFLSPCRPAPAQWSGAILPPLGMGAGTRGLPGGFDSVSRFVRTAFLRAHLSPAASEVSGFFRVLDSAAIPPGGAESPEGLPEHTLYTACMDLGRCRYIFKTHGCSRLQVLSLHACTEETEIRRWPYPETEDFRELNPAKKT